MKKIIVMSMVCLMALSVQANLVSNGDFETGDLSDWWDWGDSSTSYSVAIESTVVNSGSYSAALVSDADAWFEFGSYGFAIDSETTYELSIAYNIVDYAGFGINIKCWDSSWSQLSDEWIATVASGSEEGLATWQEYVTSITTATDVAYMEIKICAGGYGTVYIDDVSIPEPVTFALLSIGGLILRRQK